MSLLEFCRWVQYSAPMVAMRGSPWVFPVIATIHLFGLTMIGGAVLLVDLRLLGLGLRHQPVALLARDAEKWLLRGLLVAVATGILLFMCFATKYYYLTFFWVKMAALIVVVALTFSVRRRIAAADEALVGRATGRLVALVSLTLWTTVALGGRYIGFP
jgi:uncharacterized protein DUF6644